MKSNKAEKGINALLATRFAIRKDEAEKLASVSFDWDKKPNGEWDAENCIDYREDGIAVIHIDGALSYRTSLWTAWFGMDTYDSITAALDECLENPKVKGIVFDINSPGGEVSGCADLAEKIYKARGSKEYGIVARTGGLMCSAAYWIGSACEKVYTASNGTLGSIGVLCAYSKDEEEVNVIVSDLSKKKCPSPDSAEGLAQIKKELNDLAEVFISAVARNRGTTAENVEMNFGQGGVFIGENSVAAGLADGVVSLDDVCEQMKKGFTKEGAFMATEKTAPKASAEDIEEAKKKAVADYKARVSSINAVFEGLEISAEEKQKFIDEDKTVEEATSFALEQAKNKIKAQADELAKVSAELADVKAKAEDKPTETMTGIDAERDALIKKGIAAETASAEGVQSGVGENVDEEYKKCKAAFERGSKGLFK